MDGIINVLKPPGMTSADVVTWIKRTLRVAKVGHTGTLDPGTAGVLPICLGKATRLAEYLTAQGKAYRAEAAFGTTTETQDAQGRILREKPAVFSRDELEAVLQQFCGKIRQVPPMYSAVRRNGRHFYEYAREGVVLERESREVEIYRFELVGWLEGDFPRALLDIECSKGTYVRTLCHDLGEVLGCGAHMSYLLRTRSGPFSLEDSWTLEEIEAGAGHGDTRFLLPLPTGLGLSQVSLPRTRAEAFIHGLPTCAEWVDGVTGEDGTEVQVFSGTEFIGIGQWRSETLYPHKVMA